MATSRNDVLVQCPFYRSDVFQPKQRIKRINCEGLVADSTLALNYRFQRDYFRQLETFCCRHYDKCEVYRMLMEKYEEV